MGVSNTEVNYYITEKIVMRNPVKFYKFLKTNKKKISISFKRSRLYTYIIKKLYDNGFDVDKLSVMFSKQRNVIRGKLNANVSNSYKNAFELLDIDDIFFLADELPYNIVLSRQKIRKVLAKELLKRGVDKKVVAKNFGVSIRTVERFKQEIDYEKE